MTEVDSERVAQMMPKVGCWFMGICTQRAQAMGLGELQFAPNAGSATLQAPLKLPFVAALGSYATHDREW